jgi:hypothetical protein
VPDSPTSAYTVPANKIAVIRFLQAIAGDATQFTMGVGSTDPEDSLMVRDYADGVLIPGEFRYDVLAAGEQLFVTQTTTGAVVTSIDGDLLDA